MFNERRVREVMRERRCTWEEACAWLGRRGAEARERKRRRREYGSVAVAAIEELPPVLEGGRRWWDN